MRSTNDFDPQQWLVYIPKGYDPNRRHPLVVLFHDDSSNPEEILAHTRFERVADEHGFVIIAPANRVLMYVWSQRGALNAATRAVQETTARLCIDEDRQVLVGHASGSAGPEALSCDDWVDGIVSTAYVGDSRRWACEDIRPVPSMIILPARSGFSPPAGGNDCTGAHKISFRDVQELWRGRNRCGAHSKVWLDHHDGTCSAYTCSAPFIYCEVDGGRRWPGAPPRRMDLLSCDGPDSKFPQTEAVAKFVNELRRD